MIITIKKKEIYSSIKKKSYITCDNEDSTITSNTVNNVNYCCTGTCYYSIPSSYNWYYVYDKEEARRIREEKDKRRKEEQKRREEIRNDIKSGRRCPYYESTNVEKWKTGLRVLTGIFILGISEANIHKRYCYNYDNYFSAYNE
jgi:hypothetical protein